MFSLSKGSSWGGTQLETSALILPASGGMNASVLKNGFGRHTIISIRGREAKKSRESLNFLFCLSTISLSLYVSLYQSYIYVVKVRFNILQSAYFSCILKLYCKVKEGVGGVEEDKDGEEKEEKMILI